MTRKITVYYPSGTKKVHSVGHESVIDIHVDAKNCEVIIKLKDGFIDYVGFPYILQEGGK